MPKHIFSPDDLKDSNNPFIKSWGFEYSFDKKKGPGHGLEQLFKDFKRNVRVADNTGKEFGSDKDQKVFERFLQENFTDTHIAQIQQHYSQGPQLFLGVTPATATMNLMEEGLVIQQPEGDDLVSSLYLEDGEVYFKSVATRLPVKDIKNDVIIGYIEGPLEVTFKLDPERGFVLQTLQTDSDFLRDLYQDKEITAERLRHEATNGMFLNLLAKFEENINKDLKKHKDFDQSPPIQLFLEKAREHAIINLAEDQSLDSENWKRLFQLVDIIINFPSDSAVYRALFSAFERVAQVFNASPYDFAEYSKYVDNIIEMIGSLNQIEAQLDNLPEGSPFQKAAEEYFARQGLQAIEILNSGDLEQLNGFLGSLTKSKQFIEAVNRVIKWPDNFEVISILCQQSMDIRNDPGIQQDEAFIEAVDTFVANAINHAMAPIVERRQAALREASETGSPIPQLEQAWIGELINKAAAIPRNLVLGTINENGINQIFASIKAAKEVFDALNQLREQIAMLPAELVAVSTAYLDVQFANSISALTAEEKRSPNASQQINNVTTALTSTTALLNELIGLKAQAKLNPLIDLVYRAASEEAQKLLKDPQSDPDHSKKKVLQQALSNAREVGNANFAKLGALDKSIKAMQKKASFGNQLQGALMMLCGAGIVVLGWFLSYKSASHYGNNLMARGAYLGAIGSRVYESKPDLARSMGKLYAEVTEKQEPKVASAIVPPPPAAPLPKSKAGRGR